MAPKKKKTTRRTTAPVKTKTSIFAWFVAFIFFLIIAALVGAGYIFYRDKQAKLKAFDDKIAEQKENIEKLTETKNSLQDEKGKWEKLRDGQKDYINQLKGSISKAKTLLAGKIADKKELERQRARLVVELNALLQQKDDLEKKKQEPGMSEADIAAIDKEIAALEVKIEAKQDEIKKIDKEIAKKNNEIKLISTEITALENRLQEAEADLALMESKIKEINDEITTITALISIIGAQLAQLEHERKLEANKSMFDNITKVVNSLGDAGAKILGVGQIGKVSNAASGIVQTSSNNRQKNKAGEQAIRLKATKEGSGVSNKSKINPFLQTTGAAFAGGLAAEGGRAVIDKLADSSNEADEENGLISKITLSDTTFEFNGQTYGYSKEGIEALTNHIKDKQASRERLFKEQTAKLENYRKGNLTTSSAIVKKLELDSKTNNANYEINNANVDIDYEKKDITKFRQKEFVQLGDAANAFLGDEVEADDDDTDAGDD